ncbi:hypothetical protein AgCh_039272 [Apium graveolens]
MSHHHDGRFYDEESSDESSGHVYDRHEPYIPTKYFKGLSFPTISSVGEEGAIIHYTPDAKTCVELDPNKIYMCDSRAQVFKGHVALGNFRFPCGTMGPTLDILARLPLWKVGLDYRHETGHGVGIFLNVHEGKSQLALLNSVLPVVTKQVIVVPVTEQVIEVPVTEQIVLGPYNGRNGFIVPVMERKMPRRFFCGSQGKASVLSMSGSSEVDVLDQSCQIWCSDNAHLLKQLYCMGDALNGFSSRLSTMEKHKIRRGCHHTRSTHALGKALIVERDALVARDQTNGGV